MTVQELTEKRAALWSEATNFLDERTGKDGKISAEDAAAYDKMEADIDAMGKQIDRLKRRESMDAYMSAPASAPILNYPNSNVDGKTGRASAEYKSAFMAMFRTNFKKINNVLQESVDASGGYLVPDEWDSRLIDGLAEENIMRRLGTTITTSGEHKITITANKPAASWVAEGAALTFGTATFGQKTLDAHKLHVAVKVTNELLTDNAFNLENYLIEQFTQAISNAEEDAFLNGAPDATSGAITKPTGLFVTAADATNSPISTTGNSVSGDDIISLVYSLKRPYRRKAAFILNDATLAAIRKIKDQNQAYMWQPSYTQNEPDRLFGFPLYTSAYAPTATAGEPLIAFGDFSYYNIADRGVRSIKELRELFAGNDQTGFVMLERVDGVLVLPEAVKVLKMKA